MLLYTENAPLLTVIDIILKDKKYHSDLNEHLEEYQVEIFPS